MGMCCLVHPLIPVSGTGTGFDSSAVKGEGDMVGWLVVLYCIVVSPTLWILP